MLMVGLTGGIASGKSMVAGIFRKAGAIVIDADLLARQVVKPGRPAWREICDLFGDRVVDPDGNLDRTELGRLVFGDSQLRRQLEAIIHPLVRTRIESALQKIARTEPNAVVIQEVPLLLETGMEKGLAEIIVVYASESQQLQRLMLRDGMARQEAQARIDAQMPIEEKRKKATIVIDNSGSLEATKQQSLRVYAQLAQRAGGGG